MLPRYLIVHITYIQVPDDTRAIMTNNWILPKQLWGSIIMVYGGKHKDNTEEIYEITFLNI